MIREHRVPVNGRTLAVLEAGDESGHAIVAIHGTPGSGLLWRGMIKDAEARGMRLLAYDRPGYGGSDPHPNRTVADAAGDVAAIADALGIDRFAVEGGSGGGPHTPRRGRPPHDPVGAHRRRARLAARALLEP